MSDVTARKCVAEAWLAWTLLMLIWIGLGATALLFRVWWFPVVCIPGAFWCFDEQRSRFRLFRELVTS